MSSHSLFTLTSVKKRRKRERTNGLAVSGHHESRSSSGGSAASHQFSRGEINYFVFQLMSRSKVGGRVVDESGNESKIIWPALLTTLRRERLLASNTEHEAGNISLFSPASEEPGNPHRGHLRRCNAENENSDLLLNTTSLPFKARTSFSP